ncbi:MAG TPA: lasso peptide biosynthesis B2 protein [Anaerolineae bacterium]|nr:lasso peptide biosynthesis B2 protein [Anaerolineae bacterium]
MSWQTRLAHLNLAASRLPGLAARGAQRQLLAEMRQLCRQLPAILQQPLPEAMAQLTPEEGEIRPLPDEAATRQLADLAALLERQSPLGLCLRRSLVRYHYLRQLDIPVVVKFGAKFVGGAQEKDVAGHAWLEVNGRVYHEPEENWRGFTVMFVWPPSA